MESKSRASISTFEAFTSAVLRTKELIAAGTLRWAVSSSGFIKAKLDGPTLRALKAEEDTRAFVHILNEEIVKIIDTVVHGWNDDIWYRYLVLNEGDEGTELTDEQRDEVIRRVKFVKGHLPIDRIKQRTLLRRTTKREFLEEIRWETCIKKHDRQEGDLDVPFAAISFVLSKQQSDTYIVHGSHIHLGHPRKRTLTFDCHIEDLDDILEELQMVRQSLRGLLQESVE
jgi:hypothetical protein